MYILEGAWQEGTRTCVKEPRTGTQRCRMDETAGEVTESNGGVCHCHTLLKRLSVYGSQGRNAE